MAHSDEKIQPKDALHILLGPIVFDDVRSTTERTSNRRRQCYGTGETIGKGEKYINHQFRYDGRIITVSFKSDFFTGNNKISG